MRSTEFPCRCDYLQLRTPATFSDSATGVDFLHEQLTGIDNHMRDLQMVRSEILLQVNQLRSPASIIPSEVLSYIFSQLGGSSVIFQTLAHHHEYDSPHQGVILSSVSRYWRQAALETPELWRRVDINVRANDHSVMSASSAIQHCALHGQNLDIYFRTTIYNHIYSEELLELFRPLTEVLFSAEVARKVRILSLSEPPLSWLPMLPSFTNLRSLAVMAPYYYPSWTDRSISIVGAGPTVPSSLHDLQLIDLPLHFHFPVLHHCPNLVECEVSYRTPYSTFSEDLVLTNLTKLVWPAHDGLQDITSAQYLQTPTLKYLKLIKYPSLDVNPSAMTIFCHQSSATLSSLVLHGFDRSWLLGDFCELVKFPFPQLQDLQLTEWEYEALLTVLPALSVENDEEQAKSLPRLSSLTLSDNRMRVTTNRYSFYCLVLSLLHQRGAGRVHTFRLDLENLSFNTLDLKYQWEQAEVASWVESHQIVLIENLEISRVGF